MNRLAAWMIVSFLVLSLASAQEKKEQKPPQGAVDDMMKKMMELASPSEGHKKLNDLVGVWDAETKMWVGGPGQPAVSKGSAEYSWVLGGRFLREDFKGDIMGMPMTGFGFTGYDNYAKKYTGVWVDNMGTALSTMEGTFDRSGKVLTLYGKMDEWATGELSKNVKYVTRIIDKDKHVFEIHDLSIGEPNTKIVEITYTRKK
jgi:hypothetical protein